MLGGLLTCTLQTGFQQWECDVFSSHWRGTSNDSRQMQKWTWFGSWDAVIFIWWQLKWGFLLGPLDFTTKDTTLPNTGRSVRVSSCRGRGLLAKVKGQNSGQGFYNKLPRSILEHCSNFLLRALKKTRFYCQFFRCMAEENSSRVPSAVARKFHGLVLQGSWNCACGAGIKFEAHVLVILRGLGPASNEFPFSIRVFIWLSMFPNLLGGVKYITFQKNDHEWFCFR